MVFVQSSVDYFLDPEYKPLFSYIMRLEAGQGDTIDKYVLSIIKCYKSVFQLNVLTNPVLLWFEFLFLLSSLHLRKLAPNTQPIRCNVKTNHEIVFPRF